MRNKLIAICLIAALCLTFTACGSTGGSSPMTADDIEWDNDGMLEMGDYDYGLSVSDDGIMLGALEKLDYSDLGAQEEPLKETTLKLIDEAGLGQYELISDYEKMEESMEEAVEQGYDMGDIVYCTGTEEENLELGVLEVAAYHNPTENKYYQYTIYNGRSYFGAENVDGEEVSEFIKNAFGIEADPAKIVEAAKILEAKAIAEAAAEGEEGDRSEDSDAEEEIVSDDEETEDEEELSDDDYEIVWDDEGSEDADEESGDEEELTDEDYEIDLDDEDAVFYDEDGNEISLDDLDLDFGDDEESFYVPCLLRQSAEFKGDGYTDSITFQMIAENMEDGSVAIYPAIERYRCYDEQ